MVSSPAPRRFTPPGWLNALMRLMMRTPGLQNLVGGSTALLTFTGRTSGASYTTPLTYLRRGNEVILTAHVSRQWWRNVARHSQVELRLAGRVFSGEARIFRSGEALPHLIAFFQARPLIARRSRVGKDAEGRIRVGDVEKHLAETIVVLVTLGSGAG